MKKTNLMKVILGTMIAATMLPSCRDDFFEEFDKFDDSITVQGKIAAPVINSSIKFSDVKAENINPRLHFENGSDGLTHMIISQEDKIIRIPPTMTPEQMAALGLKPTPVEYSYVTTKQDIFRESLYGRMKIKNPKFTLESKTDKGSKLELKINQIDFYKDDAHIGILHPENNPTEGKVELSNENTNGKLTEILDLMPDYYTIKYTIRAESIAKNEKMKIKILLDFPLEIVAEGFSMDDTCTVDMGRVLENAESLIVKCKSENGMPFNISFKGYFLSKEAIIDSIFVDGPWKIEAAQIDGSGNTTQKTSSSKECILDKQRLQKIDKANCDKIIYRMQFSTAGNDYVKITDKQIIDMRMSFCAELGYSN